MPPRVKAATTRYRVIHGLDYDGKRAEPGEIREDIPVNSVPWLLDGGHIETVDEGGDN